MGSNGFVDLNWPWLPIGWVGCCTLGFTFAHGSIKPNLQQALVNLPYLHTRWTRSVFQWHEYVAALFVPSIGTAAAKSVTSVVSDSVRPHRRQPTRLPCTWDSPGKNTGVGCHFLLQCMKLKSESEVAQSCPTLSDPMDYSLPGSSIHGIFQARVLEWGAIAFSSIGTTDIIIKVEAWTNFTKQALLSSVQSLSRV